MDEQPNFLREYFGVFFNKQTYLNLVYLIAAFPLGLIYFVLLMTGLSLGFSLAIVLVGIPILLAMVGVIQGFGRFERALNHMLLKGGDIDGGRELAIEGLRSMSFQGVMDHVRSGQVWRTGFYLFAKFIFGIFSFTLTLTILALILGFVFAPLGAVFDGNVALVVVLGESITGGFATALAVMILGVFGAPLGLRFLNGIAEVWRRFGESMLTEPVVVQRAKYTRIDADPFRDRERQRKNDEFGDKLKNDAFADDDPFYADDADDLHIARTVENSPQQSRRERRYTDDDPFRA